MRLGIAVSEIKSLNKDFGVFDGSVSREQTCEIRFHYVNIKSFNGKTVSWGDKSNNMGFVKVPAGINTIVLDWVFESEYMTRTDYDSVRGGIKYNYTVITSDLRNITFPDVEMLPGHNYQIAGGLNKDGLLKLWLIDMTYVPSGLYGDEVSNPPRPSRTPTQIQGTWKNAHGETFEFTGNKWVHTQPPGTGQNPSSSNIRRRGTFTVSDGVLTLYVTDMYMPSLSSKKGNWLNIRVMRNAYIYHFSLEEDSLLLELPFVLPVTEYRVS